MAGYAPEDDGLSEEAGSDSVSGSNDDDFQSDGGDGGRRRLRHPSGDGGAPNFGRPPARVDEDFGTQILAIRPQVRRTQGGGIILPVLIPNII